MVSHNQFNNDKYKHSGILAPTQQKHVLKVIALITLIIFVPLGIKNLLIGELMLGAVLLAFELSLLAEITCIIYCRPMLIHPSLPIFLLVASIILSVHIFGTLASYWIFPVVMTLVFLLPKTQYVAINSLIILLTAAVIHPHQDSAITLRLVVSLVVCITICHFIVEAVRSLQEELKVMSAQDPMTGALNRSQMDSYLTEASVSSSTPAIAVIDIDEFKTINDLHGHDTGDRVIKQFTEIAKEYLDDSDVLFRLGGDEFLILFPVAEQDSVLSKLKNVSDSTRQQVLPSGGTVTFSAGIAKYQEGEPIEFWMKRADIALYQAKENGRDQLVMHRAPVEDQPRGCSQSNG